MLPYFLIPALFLYGSRANASVKSGGVCYSFPSSGGSNVPTLSIDDARLTLATRLGISRSFNFGSDRSQLDRLAIFNGLVEEVPLFEDAERGNVFVSVVGAQDPKNFLHASSPIFETLPSADPSGATPHYLAQASSQALGTTRTTVYKSGDSYIEVLGDHISIDLAAFAVKQLQTSIAERTRNDLMDIGFSADNAASSQYVTERILLEATFDVILPAVMNADAGVFIQLASLNRRDFPSPLRHEAEKQMAQVLEARSRDSRYTLLLLPSSPGISNSMPPARRSRRAEDPLQPPPSSSPTSSATPLIPRKDILDHYKSKEECEKLTRKCSGRGDCTAAPAVMLKDHFWTCKCHTTVEDIPGMGTGAKKTTHWGGVACQKKDVSVPFNIFLAFGIILLLLGYGAVSLLYQVGSEELPGVLSAGVQGPKR